MFALLGPVATESGHPEGRRPVSVQRRGRVRQRRQAPEGGALRRLRHRRRRVVRHRRRRHNDCSGAVFIKNMLYSCRKDNIPDKVLSLYLNPQLSFFFLRVH